MRIALLITFSVIYLASFCLLVIGNEAWRIDPDDSLKRGFRWNGFILNTLMGIAVVFAGQPLVTSHMWRFTLCAILGWVITNVLYMFQDLELIPFLVWKLFCTVLLWTSGMSFGKYYPVVLFVGGVAYILVLNRNRMSKKQMIGCIIAAIVVLAVFTIPIIRPFVKMGIFGFLGIGSIVCFKPSRGIGKLCLIIVFLISAWRFVAALKVLIATIKVLI